MDIRQRLQQAFDIECREHLASMRRLSRPGAAAADIAEIFRRAHSLKGAARAVDRQDIETVAHRLESLLERIQRGEVVLDSDVEGTIQAALDNIEDLASSADARISAFLSEQGRFRYLRPLYVDLLATERGSALARRIYADARPRYHALVRTALDRLFAAG